MVGLGRESYLGQNEITCFCLFSDVRVSSRFPCVITGVEGFSLDLCRVTKELKITKELKVTKELLFFSYLSLNIPVFVIFGNLILTRF